MTRRQGRPISSPAAPGFGQHLRQLREAAGLNMNELGIVINGDHCQIHRYETGKTLPDTVQAILIARELGVTVEHLMAPAVEAWLVDRGYEPTPMGGAA